MEHESLLFPFFLIFSGAAVFSTVALSLKQPLLVAYIFLGIVIGPFGFKLIDNASLLADIAEFASPTFPGRIKAYHLDRKRLYQDLLEEVEKRGVYVVLKSRS